MTIEIDVQYAVDADGLPTVADFRRWAAAALEDRSAAELAVRVVDREESRRLNGTYRGKDAPTNVLSFPAELPPGVDLPLLGDIVICAPLVGEEARSQHKRVMDHWAHLTVHGVLHLLGFDHGNDDDAAEMEALETRILLKLGCADPWRA
ncbi:MAG: rRNA maturation RNase YbeY [Xanthomonadales bacterium]